MRKPKTIEEDTELEQWIYMAKLLYRKGRTLDQIKSQIGGSKSDFELLKDYLHQTRFKP